MAQYFKAIVPKKLWNIKGVQKELKQAVNETVELMNYDFKATTKSWKHKVTFKKSGATVTANAISGFVGTDDTIYGYVTHGTTPHLIVPRRARALRFQAGYASKTTPRILGSHQGGPRGETVFAQVVHHPGTTAREFEEEIAQRRQKSLESRVAEAMLRFAKL